MDDSFPHIEPLLDNPEHPITKRYREVIGYQLRKILPPGIFVGGDDQESREDQRGRLLEALPVFTYSQFKERVPFDTSFFLVFKYRSNAFKFWFEMVSRWLVPGKRLNVVLFYAVDFRAPELGEEIYTFCEVVMRVETLEELEELRRNLPVIQTEICLGVQSAYYARRILEIKGLSADEKTAMIQEHIAYLVQRRPSDFDRDVFAEMQHVLVRCPDEFKAQRESRHMSRIISVHYLFRKELHRQVKKTPNRRHLFVKLVRARLHLADGKKRVLGLMVGLNFLRDTEVFEERHLLKAVRNFIPSVEPIEGSFFLSARASETVGTVYLEIEKNDGTDFTLSEIQRLRRELPSDLKNRIEQLMHPVFMPRNEEEVMRNILSLAGQLKYLRDIPQVMISFDEQTASRLIFTVILLRVLRTGDAAVGQLFVDTKTPLEYEHDSSKTVGYLRRRYPKEATVFRVRLPKERFLRGDHSIDLYRARRFVVGELNRVIGEFRDYNGGMISKQDELIGTVRAQLAEVGYYNDLLLENFFFSLNPVIMRSVLPPAPLKALFMMLVEAIEEGFFREGDDSVRMQRLDGFVLVLVTLKDPDAKERLDKAVEGVNSGSTELATAFVTVHDTPCVGYAYRCQDPAKQTAFFQLVDRTVKPPVSADA